MMCHATMLVKQTVYASLQKKLSIDHNMTGYGDNNNKYICCIITAFGDMNREKV